MKKTERLKTLSDSFYRKAARKGKLKEEITWEIGLRFSKYLSEACTGGGGSKGSWQSPPLLWAADGASLRNPNIFLMDLHPPPISESCGRPCWDNITLLSRLMTGGGGGVTNFTLSLVSLFVGSYNSLINYRMLSENTTPLGDIATRQTLCEVIIMLHPEHPATNNSWILDRTFYYCWHSMGGHCPWNKILENDLYARSMLQN